MMKAKPSFDAMVTNTDNCAPIQIDNAPVAQLDRVSASEAEGRAFKSRQARHKKGSTIRRPLFIYDYQ